MQLVAFGTVTDITRIRSDDRICGTIHRGGVEVDCKEYYANAGSVPLTRRELQIVKLACADLTNDEIAGRLFISKRTVEHHRHSIKQKTGCVGLAGLVKYAINHDLLD